MPLPFPVFQDRTTGPEWLIRLVCNFFARPRYKTEYLEVTLKFDRIEHPIGELLDEIVQKKPRQRHEQQYAYCLRDATDGITVLPLKYLTTLLDFIDNY